MHTFNPVTVYNDKLISKFKYYTHIAALHIKREKLVTTSIFKDLLTKP